MVGRGAEVDACNRAGIRVGVMERSVREGVLACTNCGEEGQCTHSF